MCETAPSHSPVKRAVLCINSTEDVPRERRIDNAYLDARAHPSVDTLQPVLRVCVCGMFRSL